MPVFFKANYDLFLWHTSHNCIWYEQKPHLFVHILLHTLKIQQNNFEMKYFEKILRKKILLKKCNLSKDIFMCFQRQLWHQSRFFRTLSILVLKPSQDRLHKVSGQPVSVPDWYHGQEVSVYTISEPYLFHLKPRDLHFPTRHHCEVPGSTFLTTSL